MAYVDKDKAAKIKAAVKEATPKGWKTSVAIHNLTEVRLTISHAPIDLIAKLKKRENYGNSGHVQINDSYVESAFDDAEVTAIMMKFKEALNIGNFNNSDTMTDYFHVGHYTNIQLGRWDKPFQVKA